MLICWQGETSKAAAHLYRGDGAVLGGGDTLLHGTHVCGQCRLVTHSRGDTAQQGGHLRASLGEPAHQ